MATFKQQLATVVSCDSTIFRKNGLLATYIYVLDTYLPLYKLLD